MEVLLNIGVALFNTVARIILQIPAVEGVVNTIGNISGLGTISVLGILVLGALFE